MFSKVLCQGQKASNITIQISLTLDKLYLFEITEITESICASRSTNREFEESFV